MNLIDTDVFLRREWAMSMGTPFENRTKVFNSDAKAIEYAILSHRWIGDTEVSYDEMVDLAKMKKGERNEIRERAGYKKILDTCWRAKNDGYKWVWVDTCCIDRRNSTKLSEAIISMYRWYANAKVCYAYLHDVDGSSFPTNKAKKKYPRSNGWPEWFSRGWTLQEMIAPRNLQFFNKDWQPIGDKKRLAQTLDTITGVPVHILTGGLDANRPVDQIMSWAANRTTKLDEDRAYSLMGLLGVNMVMMYGEGEEEAFRRLRLEVESKRWRSLPPRSCYPAAAPEPRIFFITLKFLSYLAVMSSQFLGPCTLISNMFSSYVLVDPFPPFFP